MKADTEILDEVVVVAYGTATKKSFTGSATEIKGEKISLKNPTELSKALSGEVAGVQVMSTSGQRKYPYSWFRLGIFKSRSTVCSRWYPV